MRYRLRGPFALCCLTLLLAGCQPTFRPVPPEAGAASRPHVEYLASADPAMKDLPFSEAVRVGKMLYLSGQIGIVPGSLELVEGGTLAETRQTLENIRAVLERHGSSIDRVVRCTVMMADMDQWAAMNEVYVTFFPTNKPARSAMGASGLALGARVEIECIAVVG
jgi:2-iminobutanoate/2-iminopropanoate deaminase